MQWSEVIKPPSPKMLRQFAGLLLVFFLVLAGWRVFTGRSDAVAAVLAGLGALLGGLGLAWPAAIRPVYTGWMIAAFPIGWVVSRVILAGIFYLVITPVALVFRVMGRDALRRRETGAASSWLSKRQPGTASEYFRQF